MWSFMPMLMDAVWGILSAKDLGVLKHEGEMKGKGKRWQ